MMLLSSKSLGKIEQMLWSLLAATHVWTLLFPEFPWYFSWAWSPKHGKWSSLLQMLFLFTVNNKMLGGNMPWRQKQMLVGNIGKAPLLCSKFRKQWTMKWPTPLKEAACFSSRLARLVVVRLLLCAGKHVGYFSAENFRYEYSNEGW